MIIDYTYYLDYKQHEIRYFKTGFSKITDNEQSQYIEGNIDEFLSHCLNTHK